MEKNLDKGSTAIYWVLFIIFFVIQVIFFIWIREYFWVILPFVLTTFAKAIRII